MARRMNVGWRFKKVVHYFAINKCALQDHVVLLTTDQNDDYPGDIADDTDQEERYDSRDPEVGGLMDRRLGRGHGVSWSRMRSSRERGSHQYIVYI